MTCAIILYKNGISKCQHLYTELVLQTIFKNAHKQHISVSGSTVSCTWPDCYLFTTSNHSSSWMPRDSRPASVGFRKIPSAAFHWLRSDGDEYPLTSRCPLIGRPYESPDTCR